MNLGSPKNIDELIRQSGEDWIFNRYHPAVLAGERIRQRLEDITRLAVSRLGPNAPSFSEQILVEEYSRNPEEVRGFLQAIAAASTPEMLLMAWQVIRGMAIQQVIVEYKSQQSFKLRVMLELEFGDGVEIYESSNIADLNLLNHFGAYSLGETPVLDGFYPLRLKHSSGSGSQGS